MNPRITNVTPEKDYMLRLRFTNGEVRRFDVKPYLEYEVFRPLKDERMFNTVRPFLDSIQWANEADLCPEFYMDSVAIEG
ncbi:MAG: DUF2442 domain-containing protein [Tannerella sp.]|jgi:hypothetical protein|nr:DUF2442 domain-containing protein [Tannerella sp.]